MPRTDKVYLGDMQKSIDQIGKYLRRLSYLDFVSDQKTIDAVVRNFEIIGEAATHVSPATKKNYPMVPWKKAMALRNKAIHEYFGLDLGIVWQTAKKDLSMLKRQIDRIIKQKNF